MNLRSSKWRAFRSLLFALVGTLAASAAVRGAELNVFAAASLKEALEEIAAGYERESGDRIIFNFAASSTLARQIDQGAAADLFFSADQAKLDGLEKKGLLLAGTRRTLLSNTLVIIVAADAGGAPKSAADLAGPAVKRLALAEPATVPAGIYAREYLEKQGLWEAVKDKVVPTENVRGALAAVESGNVEAGIVYRTDALISKKVKIAVEVPAAEGPKISYPLAVLKDAKDPESAGKFAACLAGAPARVVFEKFGFVVVK